MQYLLCEADSSDDRLPGDQHPSVQTQHVSCISSPSSPFLVISPPGVAALPVSVKHKYFLATEKWFQVSRWHCKQTDGLPSTATGNARQGLLLLICCAASRIKDSLLSVFHWTHCPAKPQSPSFPQPPKPSLCSLHPSLLPSAWWTSFFLSLAPRYKHAEDVTVF